MYPTTKKSSKLFSNNNSNIPFFFPIVNNDNRFSFFIHSKSNYFVEN